MSRSGDAQREAGSAYAGARIVFGTRHGKQEQARRSFRRLLGAQVLAPAELGVDLDTDQFGTFSAERPRVLSPHQAALAKAHLAIAQTGLPRALASEASYGILPALGWPGHEELLVFVDAERGIQVLERVLSPVVPGRTWRLEEASQIPFDELVRIGWPQQAAIVRAAGGPVIAKGVTDDATLRAAVASAVGRSPDRVALLEPDLRAHHNPSRREVLDTLCARLARRLATACPRCGAPGWGIVGTDPGLPCRWCRSPTQETAATTYGCAGCPATDVVPTQEPADPRHCPRCNP